MLRVVDEGLFEAEAEGETVVITRLVKDFLLSPFVLETRGVVIPDLSDKEDDAMTVSVASSVKGGIPGTGSSDSKSMGE